MERFEGIGNGWIHECGCSLVILRGREHTRGDLIMPTTRLAEHGDQRSERPVSMVEMSFVDRNQLPGNVTRNPLLIVPMQFEVTQLCCSQVRCNNPTTGICELLRLRAWALR